jgi:2-polyprenyl-3-methyl-5-hydroxy-6-metoxy-1,4-benzoquinol methylase
MTHCVVCGSAARTPLYTGIVRCSSCGHVYADLQLSDEEMLELYRKNYFFGEEYSDYLRDKSILQKNFRARMQVLKRFLGKDHKSLLEIGSAYGFFLEVAKPAFERVLGIDITEDGCHYASQTLGMPVVQDDFLAHDFGNERFDVMTMWDTIEHLREPNLYLEKLATMMPTGGLLTFTTGDIDGWNARLRKEHWRMIHPPTHVHYFSRRTLAQMLERYGFETVYSKHCGFYRSLDMVAYMILVLRQGNQKLYDALAATGLTKFDFYLNMYDIMYVIARKR